MTIFFRTLRGLPRPFALTCAPLGRALAALSDAHEQMVQGYASAGPTEDATMAYLSDHIVAARLATEEALAVALKLEREFAAELESGEK
jgi:hypothetical protein